MMKFELVLALSLSLAHPHSPSTTLPSIPSLPSHHKHPSQPAFYNHYPKLAPSHMKRAPEFFQNKTKRGTKQTRQTKAREETPVPSELPDPPLHPRLWTPLAH